MSDLPKCMYEKRGSYYLVKNNKWMWLGKNLELALQRYEDLTQAIPRDVYKAVYRRARGNAAGRMLEFLLTEHEFDEIVKRAAGACELTGIPFSMQNTTLSKRRPFAPSLDRVNCGLPYTKGNCRLVTVCVNAALSDWGEDVFRIMVSSAKLI